MSGPLPSFLHPPVVETAIGIQFEDLPSFSAVHFGRFHKRLEQRYPVAADKPRLSRIIETFPRVQPMRLTFAMGLGAVPNRVWYLNASDGDTLVQLQSDRFGFNWRKTGENPYPSFDTNLRECEREYAELEEFCRLDQLGSIRPDVCEVAYVNHIRPEVGEDAAELFTRLLVGNAPLQHDDFLPPVESATFNRVYVIGQSQGRLYAEASIATDDKGDFIELRMVGRTICTDGGPIAAVRLAHDWVVRAFVSITDPEIRISRWKQQP